MRNLSLVSENQAEAAHFPRPWVEFLRARLSALHSEEGAHPVQFGRKFFAERCVRGLTLTAVAE